MDPKATCIQAIGEALYGEAGWKARFADALGLSRQHVGAIVAGERRVTPDIEERIARWLHEEIRPQLIATTAEIERHIGNLTAELGLALERATHSSLSARIR